MQPLSFESITTDAIRTSELSGKDIHVDVLRLDKIHPVISGNKWFKLKYYLQKAKAEKKEWIVTFGGAYSNHLVATAAAGKLEGIKTVGIVRGERPSVLSGTLERAAEYGMEFLFVGRSDFRNKAVPSEIAYGRDRILLVREGGYGMEGAKGASEIMEFCNSKINTHLCCAVGTATMMAGLVRTASSGQHVFGISVLKNNFDLETDMRALLPKSDLEKNMKMIHDYHFGGYAKYTNQLIEFMNKFYLDTSIPLDFVYTGKLFYAIFDLIKNDRFPPGSRILLIHSGGLLGNLSLPAGTLVF